MKFRLGVAAAALAALGISVPNATSTVGFQDVQLGCSDGTNLALSLEASSVTQLTDAASATTLYPAGDPALTCSVSQSSTVPLSPNPTSSDGRQDFAVGGGQIPSSCPLVPFNFALSAHAPTGTPTVSGAAQPGAGGSFTLTIPGEAGQVCPGFAPDDVPAHLVSKVDCVAVTANPSGGGAAEITARITHSTGFFARIPSLTPGREVSISTTDSGTNMGDMLSARETNEPCNFLEVTLAPVLRGNVNVRSGA